MILFPLYTFNFQFILKLINFYLCFSSFWFYSCNIKTNGQLLSTELGYTMTKILGPKSLFLNNKSKKASVILGWASLLNSSKPLHNFISSHGFVHTHLKLFT